MCSLKRVLTSTLLAVVFAFGALILFQEAASAAQKAVEEVKIGILAKRGVERCLEKWEPTTEYLTQEIPGYSFTVVPLDHKEIYSAVEQKKIKFILVNPSFYVGLELRNNASRIATLKNMRIGGVYTVFGGVIFSRADRKEIKSIADLKGKTFMAVDENSFGGWQTVWRKIKEQGIDPYRDFTDLSFGGTHDAVILAVRDGIVDAGSVRTDALERMAIEGKIDLADFHIVHKHCSNHPGFPFVHSTRLYPEWPFAKLETTPDELAEQVAATLLKMSPESQPAVAARCAGWTIPHNYQSVHECLKYLRVGPYKNYGKITFRDLIQQYLPWLLGGFVVALLIVIFFALHVARLNRELNKVTTEQRKELAERKRAEEALRESEEHFRAIFETAQDSIFIKNRTLKYTHVNPAMEKLFGLSASEMIGQTDADLFGKEAGVHIREVDTRVLDGEIIEEEHTKPVNGVPVTFHVIKVPTRDDSGKITGLCGIARDITGRKRMEKMLEIEQQQFHAMFDGMDEVVYVADPNTYEMLYMNGPAKKCWGDGIGQKCYRVLQNLDSPCEFCTNDRIFGEKEGQSYVWEFQNTIGHRWYRCIDKAIRWSDGRMVRFEIAIDIHERKQAEEARARLATAVEQAAEVVVVTETDGTILYVNPVFEKITGYSRAEAIGKNPNILKSGKHDQAFYQNLWDTLNSGETWRGHITNKRKDGSLYEEEATISPVFDETGKIINFVAVKRDITDEIALEAQLRHVQKMEAIGRLASGVAHDFNNLLSGIRGNADLLLFDLPVDSHYREYIEEITKASDHAANLSNQLLAYARKGNYLSVPVDLHKMINDVIGILKHSIDKRIEIKVQLSAPNATVEGDPAQLQSVILNLAINAKDAMPDGGTLTLNTKTVTLDDDYCQANSLTQGVGKYLSLSASDTGIGMDKEVLARMFDPFFTTKEPGKGTGLGLSSIYGYIKSHGGAIEVDSEPGKGSTFKLFLPVIETRVTTPQKIEESMISGEGHVLLVDDEEMIRSMARSMLQKAGYKVTTCNDGRETLETYQQMSEQIDLVILDMVMPKLSGRDTFKALKEINPHVKVLLSSGYSDQNVQEILDEGIIGFIQKPFRMNEFLHKVKTTMDCSVPGGVPVKQ